MANRSPIIEFADEEAARKSLKEWQHRLYLDDWILKIVLVESSEFPKDQGQVEIDSIHKAAIVRIAKHESNRDVYTVKLCHEVTLVHELMHCKLDLIDNAEERVTIEGVCYDRYLHNVVDTMARSLIMAKYDLQPEWFSSVGTG